jgi:hypothetical protein
MIKTVAKPILNEKFTTIPKLKKIKLEVTWHTTVILATQEVETGGSRPAEAKLA